MFTPENLASPTFLMLFCLTVLALNLGSIAMLYFVLRRSLQSYFQKHLVKSGLEAFQDALPKYEVPDLKPEHALQINLFDSENVNWLRGKLPEFEKLSGKLVDKSEAQPEARQGSDNFCDEPEYSGARLSGSGSLGGRSTMPEALTFYLDALRLKDQYVYLATDALGQFQLSVARSGEKDHKQGYMQLLSKIKRKFYHSQLTVFMDSWAYDATLGNLASANGITLNFHTKETTPIAVKFSVEYISHHRPVVSRMVAPTGLVLYGSERFKAPDDYRNKRINIHPMPNTDKLYGGYKDERFLLAPLAPEVRNQEQAPNEPKKDLLSFYLTDFAIPENRHVFIAMESNRKFQIAIVQDAGIDNTHGYRSLLSKLKRRFFDELFAVYVQAIKYNDELKALTDGADITVFSHTPSTTTIVEVLQREYMETVT